MDIKHPVVTSSMSAAAVAGHVAANAAFTQIKSDMMYQHHPHSGIPPVSSNGPLSSRVSQVILRAPETSLMLSNKKKQNLPPSLKRESHSKLSDYPIVKQGRRPCGMSTCLGLGFAHGSIIIIAFIIMGGECVQSAH